MNDKTHKERLEQELRFLKESLDAEVISKGEFDKGKERIEKKLKEIENHEIRHEEKETEPAEQVRDIEAKKNESGIKDESPEIKKTENITENKQSDTIKLKVTQDTDEHEHFEEIKKTEIHEQNELDKKQEVALEHKNESRLFKYIFIFVILVLIIFFSYSLAKSNKIFKEKGNEIKFVAKPEEKINVLILNDRKDCFNCETQRVLNILQNWFGPIETREIDYNSNEGRNLAEKNDAKLLPAYILDENITKRPSFEQFKQAFIKKDAYYVLNEDAAGSTFYLNRDNMSNKLDLFIIAGDSASIKAEKNLREFLDVFKETKFEKHYSNDSLAKELNIKTFPTFLLNNKIKFSGVQSAETIKENYCKMNKLPECDKSLSKNLI